MKFSSKSQSKARELSVLIAMSDLKSGVETSQTKAQANMYPSYLLICSFSLYIGAHMPITMHFLCFEIIRGFIFILHKYTIHALALTYLRTHIVIYT